MAIRVKQIGRIANAVISSFLQTGQLPSVRSVLAGIYAQLDGTVAGTPRMSYAPVAPIQETDPAALNLLAAEVADDVQNLYDEAIDQVNRVVRDFDHKQTQRERLAQRMVALSAELTTPRTDGAQVVRGTIDSFAAIDAANTTAHLNFRDYCVELPPATNRTAKIDLTGASVTYKVDGQVRATIGTAADVLTDSVNTAFFVQTAAAGNAAALSLTLTLRQPALVSKIVASTHAGSPVQLGLVLEGETVTSVPVDVTRRAVWDVAARQISSLTITVAKSQPDQSEGGLNLFDFGLRNISLYAEEYVPQAQLVTAPVQFGVPIGVLELDVTQQVPPNCAIAWGYSTTGPKGPFTSLAPGAKVTFGTSQTVDAKRVLPARTIHDAVRVTNQPGGTAADVGLPVLAPVRGGRTPLFSLCRISPNISARQSTVRRGRGAWSVSSYHYDTERLGVISDPPPTLADFISPRSSAPIYTRFQPTEPMLNTHFPGLSSLLAAALRLPAAEYPIRSESDRVMHLFEATLTVDPTLAPSVLATLSTLQIALPTLFAGGRAALYLNGAHIPVNAQNVAGSLAYSAIVPLQPGANSLQIVTNNYISLGGGPFDVGAGGVLASYLAPDATGYAQVTWYAEAGPMTEVSLFELQYQTSRNDFSRYARAQDPSSSAQLLVVRELPTTAYDITTKGLTDAGAPQSVILSATLSGSSVQPSLTPKILSYQLAMSY